VYIVFVGGIVLEEAVDLSYDRLLMNECVCNFVCIVFVILCYVFFECVCVL
jgi:hypothetical protein